MTETPTILLAVAMTSDCNARVPAIEFPSAGLIFCGLLTGIIAGIAVLFRPDSGLFAAALGSTLGGFDAIQAGREVGENDARVTNTARRLAYRVIARRGFIPLAFCLVLIPWTIRNERVFHLFQPLAPPMQKCPASLCRVVTLVWLPDVVGRWALYRPRSLDAR